MKRQKNTPASILVVDDDPAFCTVMRVFLRRDGFDVHLAFDVRDAYKVIEDAHPDIILTDIMMPETDGLELIRGLRKKPEWRNTPIVVISARVMPEDRQAAQQAGADAFIGKPFSFRDLRSLLDRFLSRNNHRTPQLAGL